MKSIGASELPNTVSSLIMDIEQTQDILYRLADDYDQLAARIAERAAKPSPT